MLEKIFGKKSTGVVYIVCVSFLLLALLGALVSFVASYPDASLYPLLVQALLTLIALFAVSAPVFIQKKFRYYIPPFIEISLCVYVTLLFVLPRFEANTVATFSFLPAAGGFVVSMLLFAVIYSALSKKAQTKQKSAPVLTSALLTVGAAFMVIIIMAALSSLTSRIMETPVMSRKTFLMQCFQYLFGTLLFCVTGCFAVRSHGERFRIHNFKNPERAEKIAAEKKNKTLYTVVKNISSDTTNYERALARAKAGYYAIRILYLVLYAAYIIHACFAFSQLGVLGYTIIFALISSFLFTAFVYIYEYFLFRKGAPNQRLRRLKIAKTVSRCYTLSLMLVAMFVADYNYNILSAVLSVGMLLFNLCLMFYNIFGKPKYYPSAKKQKNADPLISESKADTGESDSPSPLSEGGQPSHIKKAE